MTKYDLTENDDQSSILDMLWHISNELAEANRLKRIVIIQDNDDILTGAMMNLKRELEDQA